MSNYCKYEDKGQPYLKLQPLKLEVLLDEPLVHMYHDVVSDKDIAEMKRMASSTVRDSIIYCQTEPHSHNAAEQFCKLI